MSITRGNIGVFPDLPNAVLHRLVAEVFVSARRHGVGFHGGHHADLHTIVVDDDTVIFDNLITPTSKRAGFVISFF